MGRGAGAMIGGLGWSRLPGGSGMAPGLGAGAGVTDERLLPRRTSALTKIDPALLIRIAPLTCFLPTVSR
jgi:hypothetical protein